MMAERMALVELEERFAKDKDKDKVELKKVQAELASYHTQVKKVLDTGVSPQEFRSLDKYRAALEQARDLAHAVWVTSQTL
jgi:flagellar biosynthesis chaperone FliJ